MQEVKSLESEEKGVRSNITHCDEYETGSGKYVHGSGKYSKVVDFSPPCV